MIYYLLYSFTIMASSPVGAAASWSNWSIDIHRTLFLIVFVFEN